MTGSKIMRLRELRCAALNAGKCGDADTKAKQLSKVLEDLIWLLLELEEGRP